NDFFKSSILKKSQTATEYLIILAVVIVIALIVVGVLGGIPSIGGGASESASKIELSNMDVGITAYMQNSHSTLFKLRNNNPNTVRIDDIWVDGKKCTLYPHNTRLSAGTSKKVYCYGVVGYNEGQKYNYDLNLTYTDMETSATYTLTPDTGLVGDIVERKRTTHRTAGLCSLCGSSSVGL
ncbi:MAG: hypothetical protein ACQER9_03065, partial [Nanobdellota archaeon]